MARAAKEVLERREGRRGGEGKAEILKQYSHSPLT